MKKLLAMVLVFAMVTPVFAVENGQVIYVGGTVPGLKNEVTGNFNFTQADSMVFEHPDGKLVIPYAKIERYQYSEKLAYHLGVIATLAVVLVKYRHRRHFYQISYKDDAGVTQVAIFEVAKQMPQTVSAVLDARVPKPCVPMRNMVCSGAVLVKADANKLEPPRQAVVTPVPEK